MNQLQIKQAMELFDRMKRSLNDLCEINLEHLRLLLHSSQLLCEHHLNADPFLESLFLEMRSVIAEFERDRAHAAKLAKRIETLIEAVNTRLRNEPAGRPLRSEHSLSAARSILTQLRRIYGDDAG